MKRRRFSIVAVFWHIATCPRARRAFRQDAVLIVHTHAGRIYECPCGYAVIDAYGMGGPR